VEEFVLRISQQIFEFVKAGMSLLTPKRMLRHRSYELYDVKLCLLGRVIE
jgi:hypothetical protein